MASEYRLFALPTDQVTGGERVKGEAEQTVGAGAGQYLVPDKRQGSLKG